MAKWHAQIGDPTVADSILDRLVHAAHRIELQGESMRKKKGGAAARRCGVGGRRAVFFGANSSRPTGSFRQRQKTRTATRGGYFPCITDKENKQNS